MRHFWLGSILLSTALSSSAVTLGRHSGAAVLGRPLDVRVQMVLASDESTDNLCVRPEVFFGESLVSQVSVGVIRATPDSETSLRIQTTAAVNEPFVTLSLRIGCTAPFTRRYVLLADPANQTADAPAIAAITVSAAAPSAPSAALPADVRVDSGSRARSGESRQTQSARTSSPPVRSASVVRKSSAEKPIGPRLELDPIDIGLLIERDPVLKLSPILLSETGAGEEARQAALALWKAINASPEYILAEARKLAELESEVRSLREQAGRQQAQAAELQTQLDKATWYRTLSLGMGALILLLLAGAFAWRRRERQAAKPAWWARAQGEMPAAAAQAESAAKTSRVRRGLRSMVRPGRQRPVPALDLDLDLDQPPVVAQTEKTLDSQPASSVPLRDSEIRRDFAPSVMAQGRSVAMEELFDVQQQADFFVSLGQHEQAIEILRNHLEESHEPSPLAYLDLLKIYHSLGRRADYEEARADFNEVFNAGAPPFDHYSDSGRGLEAYETAFSRIQALWPQPKVLDLIERSIFRDSQTLAGEVFDLEAYRELLFLHAMAKEIVEGAERGVPADPASNDFQHTSLKPLKAVTRHGPLQEVSASPEARPERITEPMLYAPPPSTNIGLDVDLDALVDVSVFEASLPEVAAPIEPTAKAMPSMESSLEGRGGNLIDFEFLDLTAPPEPKDPPKS